MKIKHTLIAVAAIAALSASVLPAAAVAPKEAPVVCDIKSSLDQLQQFKADASPASVDAELALRRKLIEQSMDCNAREARAIAGTVSNLTASTRTANLLKAYYIAKLTGAAAYADQQGAAAAKLDSVTTTKDFARDLKSWRTDTYNPITWEAAQLIVLDRNTVLAQSAQDRLVQLKASAADMKDAEGIDAINEQLTQAAKLIDTGNKNLMSALTRLHDSPKVSQETITNSQKEGLDNLSQAYHLLIEVNEKLAEYPTK